MATYITGLTDYVPQVQPWRPNYNFYQPIFQQKQAKYDAGWDKVNNMYNSVLNAPMLREDNKLKRDDFFKNAQQQIQQLSGVDLSLAQNVDAAAQVFEPFYNDKNIIKDIGFTQKYQDEMQHAEYLRNCTDPEKCGDKYWSGGVRAMNYQAEDFVNASAEEALGIAAPKYVNYYNVMKKATAAVKEAGLSMKTDVRTGGMIVTTQNGSQLTMPLMNFMMARFGDDPELQDFYSTKALLLTKENPDIANKMYMKAMQNPQASQEQIKQETNNEILNENYVNSKDVIQKTATKEENRFMTMVRKKNVLTADIKKNGVVPGSKEANQFLTTVKDVNTQDNVVNNLNNMKTSAENTDEGLQRQGLTANADQMRNVIANAMKIQDMYTTANTLAYKDYERTMKVDPYAMEATRFSNQKQLAAIKQQYTLQNKAYDYTFKKSLAEINHSLKIGGTGTSIKEWSRPDSDYYNRLAEDQANRNTTAQSSAPSTVGDQLAANILAGMSNPLSYVSSEPDMVASLMEQGRTEEANAVAQGYNTKGTIPKFEAGRGVDPKKPIITMPDVVYDPNKANDGVNVIKTTAHRFAKMREVTENDWVPFNEEGDFLNQTGHTDGSINAMRGAFNGWRAYAASQVNNWKKSASNQKGNINTDILTTQLSIASNDNNSNEADAMQLELLDFTSKIDSNIKYLGKKLKKQFNGDISTDYYAYKRATDAGYGNLPVLTAEQYKTMRWGLPTNTENAWAANSKQFRKLQSIGVDKMIALAGGDDAVYKFNEEATGAWGMGSKNPTIQMLNAYQAETKVRIKDEEQAAQNAIDKFNVGLDNAVNKLNPQTASVDGSIWNLVKDKLVIKTGDGDFSRLATKAELNNILAENIPKLKSDPKLVDWNWTSTSNKFGTNLYDFKNQKMSDGKTTPKAMLNLLSQSNYTTKAGASQGIFSGYAKPSYKEVAPAYNQAIAGWKFEQDSKKPLDKRKYKNIAQALQETKNENPYTKSMGGISAYGKDEASSYDNVSQDFLQFLGKYSAAVKQEYKNKGTEYSVSPNYTYYNKHKNQSDPSGSNMGKMNFNLKTAKIDNDWINVFEDHQNTIGTAYEEVINNFTNEASSFGGMFTDEKGKPVGQGTMTAIPAELKAVSPMRKNQNYHDSEEIVSEALINGNFKVPAEYEGVHPKEVLNQLVTSLKVPTYSKADLPKWDLTQKSFQKNDYTTVEYTLTLTNPNWLKSQGYNKAKGGSGAVIPETKAPTTIVWTVKNPKNALAKGVHPTPWDSTIGNLGIGETYVNDAISKQYGKVHYSKTADGGIQPGYTLELFNPQTGEDEEITFHAPAQAYHGTDWTEHQITLVQEMIQAKQISEDTKRKYTMMRGTRDPQELLQIMADEMGVSVQELTEQFK